LEPDEPPRLDEPVEPEEPDPPPPDEEPDSEPPDDDPDDDPDPEPPDDDPDDPEPDDDPSPDEPASLAPSDEDPRVALDPDDDDPRSFFAQPDPLKWIVGGANCLRSVPSAPQLGQNWGDGSLIPWRMSVFVAQLEQTYSYIGISVWLGWVTVGGD
jgi:hypothetical protein